MINKASRAVRFVSGSLFALAALGATGTAIAQTVPLSFVASPEIYKVIAENEQYRVIEVTWKPGQRDQFHSHPMSGGYFLTDCALRYHAPDGKFADGTRTAGRAFVQPAIPSHSLENIGQSACKLIMFEPK